MRLVLRLFTLAAVVVLGARFGFCIEEGPRTALLVTPYMAAKSPVPLRGSWRLRPLEGKDVAHQIDLSAPEPTRIELPPGSTWEISLEAPGFWAARSVVTVAPDREVTDLAVTIWPLAEVTGELRTESAGDKLPKYFEVAVLRSTKRGPEIPEGRSGCDIKPVQLPPEETRRVLRFICKLPGTTLDLSLQAEGYAPIYRLQLGLASGKPLDVGRLDLHKGGSIAGWVEAANGRIEPGKCRARLIPEVGPGGSASGRKEVERGELGVIVPPDGAFQMSGIAPGVYRLEVSLPGYAPRRAGPITVFAGTETLLRQNLILERPFDVEIVVVPARDGFGRPWRVQLSGGAEGERPSGAGYRLDSNVDESGRAKLAGAESGDYWLSVFDSFGHSFLSDPSFRIDGPGPFVREVRLDVWTIEGKVFLGDEPLAASLAFGGRHGLRSVEFSSDREGAFQGVLPKLGTWRVDIEASDPPFRVSRSVEVEGIGDDRGEVEIRLPDTRLVGKVLDEKGMPAADAFVGITVEDGISDLPTDSRGRFELRGLPPGRAILAASRGKGADRQTSDEVSVLLSEKESPLPVTLTLQSGEMWSGRVESPLGPVPGASIMAAALSPDSGPVRTQSDLSGAFSVRLPRKAKAAYAVVAAPGFGLKAQPFERGRPLVLGRESGTLSLEFPDRREGGTASIGVEIFQDGLLVPRQILFSWGVLQGERGEPGQVFRHLAGMAPGNYRICAGATPPVAGLTIQAWAATYAQCKEGNLASGGTLVLKAPTGKTESAQ